MNITNLYYSKKRFSYFTKLLNNNIKELNRIEKLNKDIVILDNNKYLSDLPNLKVK